LTINVDRQIGLALHSVRMARGMRQKEVAVRAGLSVSFLSDVENGKRGLSVLSLLKIADALSVDPCRIIRAVDPGAGRSR
jgi:transcriptional regulator with XRE-family HTH domain